MNTITELLNLEDADLKILDVRIEGSKKIITLATIPSVHFALSAIIECILAEFTLEKSITRYFRMVMSLLFSLSNVGGDAQILNAVTQ